MGSNPHSPDDPPLCLLMVTQNQTCDLSIWAEIRSSFGRNVQKIRDIRHVAQLIP
jgi:hypothetical protein